jgi:hypothetical protein
MQVTYLVIIASELENLKETRGCILFFSLLLCSTMIRIGPQRNLYFLSTSKIFYLIHSNNQRVGTQLLINQIIYVSFSGVYLYLWSLMRFIFQCERVYVFQYKKKSICLHILCYCSLIFDFWINLFLNRIVWI